MARIPRGALPALCSALVPGAGQLVNRQVDKAIGVMLLAALTGAGLLRIVPLFGPAATALFGATYVYAIADAFLAARRRA